MNVLVKISIIVAAVAVAIGGYLSYILAPKYLPWHDNPKWERFLKVYEGIIDKMYKDCESFNVTTTYGSTFGYSCGDPQNQPVFMFPGAGANTMIYGDWLIPPILSKYRALPVDFPCDNGKSRPPNGDPSKCPQTEEELAKWVYELITHPDLKISNKHKVTVLGYSYGAFEAVVAAEHYPDTIHQVIAIAPAAVFAPVETAWVMRVMLCIITQSSSVYNWFLRYMSADPDFDIETSQTPQYFEMTKAGQGLAATVLAVNPDQFSIERLSAIAKNMQNGKAAILLIGQNETVTNATRAIQHAQDSGWETRVYQNAGHLMLLEQPTRDVIARDVATILGCNEEITEKVAVDNEKEPAPEETVLDEENVVREESQEEKQEVVDEVKNQDATEQVAVEEVAVEDADKAPNEGAEEQDQTKDAVKDK